MADYNAGLVSKSLAVYVKDLRLELRSRSGLNAIFMFGVTTLALVSFSLGQSSLPPKFLGALFWIIIFFSAMSGLSQVFVREEEAQTALTLRLTADPDAVFLGKLFFNFSLIIVMAAVITPLFFIFSDAPLTGAANFLFILFIGLIDLGAATTLVAAIIAKSSVKGALFAVLSFPILIPILIALTLASEKILGGESLGEVSKLLQFLIAYAVVMITASILLFKYVWQE
ncbi:MAG: heme exporter protein CcmB [Candidatus Zixiibacteriota bacterium]